MTDHLDGRVGGLDSTLRLLAVPLVLVAMKLLEQLDAAWIPLIFIAGFLAIGYLLITALVHEDPVYLIAEIDTTRGASPHIIHHRHL